jgi:hypothetical protein
MGGCIDNPMSCKIGFNPSPSFGAGNNLKNGLEVKAVNAEKAAIIKDCDEIMMSFVAAFMLLKKLKIKV